MTLFGQVAFGEGFVRGGSDSISRLSYADVGDPQFSDPPGCWLHHQATFMQLRFPPGAAAGTDVGYFVMPPVEPGGEAPVFGGAGLATGLRDRPEVRELLRWMLSPQWGELWAANPGGSFLPYNEGFDVSRCAANGLPQDVNAMRVRLCQEAREAVGSGQWRFDASDLMPPEVGLLTESGVIGGFLQGMLDYVDHGPGNLDQVLADIDAAWP
jgi:alpha-glucoside transport system substrate-binding protein